MDLVKKITNKFEEQGDQYVLNEGQDFLVWLNFFLDKNQEDIADIQGLIIHACDLIGPVMPFEIASTWSKKLAVEFTKQVIF